MPAPPWTPGSYPRVPLAAHTHAPIPCFAPFPLSKPATAAMHPILHVARWQLQMEKQLKYIKTHLEIGMAPISEWKPKIPAAVCYSLAIVGKLRIR